MDDDILNPRRLWTRAEVLSRPTPVPVAAGLYGWYFREPPSPEVPVDDCIERHGLVLLYVGIAPRAPSAAGRASKANLRTRLRTHYAGNASGSTLRRSSGCLRGLTLRPTGSTGRLTFQDDEKTLNDWMQLNALVCWQLDPQPWVRESELFDEVSLPLNIDQNARNPFRARLKEVRARCQEAGGRRT